MKKSRFGFVFISSILLLSMIGFASAQATNWGTNVAGFIDTLVKTIEPIAKYILGETVATPTFSAGTLLFAKVLFFVLILSIIYLAVSNIDFFKLRPWALWVICVGVAILATRFLGNDLVPTILIPYSALGLFLTAGIPLVVAFFVIERGMSGDANKMVRKVAWIFFTVIFIGLWFARGDTMSWIYPVTAGIALIMMFMDGTIQTFFDQMTLDKANAMKKGTALSAIDKLIQGVHENYVLDMSGYYQHYPADLSIKGAAAYEHDLRELERTRKNLLKA